MAESARLQARPGQVGDWKIVRVGAAWRLRQVKAGSNSRGRRPASAEWLLRLLIICTADSPRVDPCNDRPHMVRSRLLIHPPAAGGAFAHHGAEGSRGSAAPRWARVQILVEECDAERLRAALFLRLKDRLQRAVLTPHVYVGSSPAWASLEVEFEPSAADDVRDVVKHSANAPRCRWS